MRIRDHIRCNLAATLSAATLLVAEFLTVTIPASAKDSTTPTSSGALSKIELRIKKEPKYVSSHLYALLALGAKAEAKVWIVEDGNTLYVDKNGNGDLTDDGPPAKPSHARSLGDAPDGSPRTDFEYVVPELAPPDGSHHKDLRVFRWNYGGEEKGYGISISVDGHIPMYAGWAPFWADSADKAPIIHFGGVLTPRMLRYKDFVVGSETRRLSLSFVTPGRGKNSQSSLNIEALPETTIPVLQIDWPTAPGAQSLHKSYPLKQRCCYWEFYDPDFKVPETAVPGTANVTVSFDGGDFPFQLKTNQIKVPVRVKEATPATKQVDAGKKN